MYEILYRNDGCYYGHILGMLDCCYTASILDTGMPTQLNTMLASAIVCVEIDN